MYRTLVALLLVGGILISVALGTAPTEKVVTLSQSDFLRLSISDEIRQDTGMWADPLHWQVVFYFPENAKREFDGDGIKPGIIIALDHPNGVDVQKYKKTYVMLLSKVEMSVQSVLKRRGWEDDWVVGSFYIRKQLGEI